MTSARMEEPSTTWNTTKSVGRRKNFLPLSVLMYTLLFLFTVFIFIVEVRDWKCSNPYHVLQPCRPGEGWCYKNSTPQDGDSQDELLDKIKRASRADKRSVKWRKAFLFSVLIFLFAFPLVLTPGRLPPWFQFYGSTLIAMLILYASSNFHAMHCDKPRANIDLALSLLRVQKGPIRK